MIFDWGVLETNHEVLSSTMLAVRDATREDTQEVARLANALAAFYALTSVR
jgi:hypothetical protein